nr:adenylyl-sulfate kinase [Chitinophaga oryzae]
MADKFVVWLTGLSGAGKSTLAAGLKKHFDFLQTASIILDGDAIRSGLNADLGFSREDRRESLRRMAEVARLFLRSGIIPIVAAISPYAEDRTAARRCFKDDIFIEVFVRCPLIYVSIET